MLEQLDLQELLTPVVVVEVEVTQVAHILMALLEALVL